MEDLFASARVGEEVSRDILFELLESTFNQTDEKLIESIDIGITVAAAMRKLQHLAAWASYTHDGIVVGSTEGEEALEMEVALADEEPKPAAVDTWARGVVQIKKAASHDTSVFKSNSGIVSPSVSSYKSSVFGKSSRRSSSTYNSKKSNTSRDSAQVIDIQLDDKYDFSNINETGYMFDMLSKAVMPFFSQESFR
jgi:hypothetical protein